MVIGPAGQLAECRAKARSYYYYYYYLYYCLLKDTPNRVHYLDHSGDMIQYDAVYLLASKTDC